MHIQGSKNELLLVTVDGDSDGIFILLHSNKNPSHNRNVKEFLNTTKILRFRASEVWVLNSKRLRMPLQRRKVIHLYRYPVHNYLYQNPIDILQQI